MEDQIPVLLQVLNDAKDGDIKTLNSLDLDFTESYREQLCFKRFFKFFREGDCLREVGVSSHANGPLYLKEFLPMSKLNLSSTKCLLFPRL